MPDTSGPEKSAASGPPVGRVVGTEDSTPLQFSVALDQDAYLQLDDVVVTVRTRPRPGAGGHRGRGHRGPRPARGRHVRLRRLPDRRGRAPRAGAGDRRGHHDAGRPRGLRAAVARRVRLPGHRRGARQGAVLRPDGAQGRGRARPRRRPDLPEPGVRRRHPRRPRVHQRDLGGRHQDQLRALPAVLDLHRWRAQERAEREGAGVQRQGRGPAVPRPRQPQAGRGSPGRLRDVGARRPRRSRRSGSSPRRPRTTSRDARTSSAAPAG